ncbi:glycosyltransferase [Vibrio renipiscarius]|uniref:glycosyltransferase n=1 Tax=Vibrio renipiscarius TaxID=1461322 RepID=UPI00069B9C57|nr:glycosyltransferase [Vibrio renipiscarius]
MKKKTNILYVHYGDDWIRGSEQCLIDLISHLDQQRFVPFVWTNNPALVPFLEEADIEYQLDTFPLLLGWTSPKMDVTHWLALVKKGRQLIQRYNISLVHANSGAPCQWMALAARLSQCPLVTHLHSDYQARDRVTLGLHLSPHVITASDAISQSLREDGYPQSKLSVVHNGVNVAKLSVQPEVDVRQRLGLQPEDTVYTTVGSLIARKGVDRIIQALRYLTLEYPNSHLVVVGDGEQKNQLIQLCEQLHLSKNVHFVGEQHNVAGWLKGSDAFVSGARQEAFGLVVAEAAVAGTPIIAPFEGGIPEIVQHGESALLYVNQGYTPLLDMMRCIHSHKEQCLTLAQRAKKTVEQQFNHRRYVSEVEAIYDELLEQTAQQPPCLLSGLKPLKTAFGKRIKSRYPDTKFPRLRRTRWEV